MRRPASDPIARREGFDAVVVGAGPNGLAAAITLARAQRSVCVMEAASTVGGGCRSAELTLPGFLHDVCSAVFPLGAGSPFFSQLPLERYGLRWIEPEVQIAHPLPDGTALVMRDPEVTAERLGADAAAYLRLVGPVVRDWRVIIDDLVGPLHVPLDPRKAVAAARFASRAVWPATVLARRFHTPAARALLAGCATHSMLALSESLTGAFALIMLASAHAVGWPIAAGGAQMLSAALAAHLIELGGEIITDRPITSLDAMPPHRAALLDLTPRQIVDVASRRFERWRWGRAYLRQLRRFRYGPGVFKLDLALDGPMPWRDPEVLRAATVHVGGWFEEVAAAAAAVAEGAIPERPFVLLGQPSLVDPSRAPSGKHTVWAYCHVPNGSTVDMTDRMLAQIERFAPGFRDRILALSRFTPADLERHDANFVGGDIGGGRLDIRQFFARPAWRPDPYRTPDPTVLVCSSSTPPGVGVHGLCGWYAARSALRGVLRDQATREEYA